MANDLKELEVIAYEISSASPQGLDGILRIKVGKESQFITLKKAEIVNFLADYMEINGYDRVKLYNRTTNTVTSIDLQTLRRPQ